MQQTDKQPQFFPGKEKEKKKGNYLNPTNSIQVLSSALFLLPKENSHHFFLISINTEEQMKNTQSTDCPTDPVITPLESTGFPTLTKRIKRKNNN